MMKVLQLTVALMVCVVALRLPAPASAAPADAAMFRLFLLDGTSLVSYGEFARVDDAVIFSMPVGGTAEEPRLHPVTLSAALVDWPRTERYAASARFQQYAARAEADYQRLTDDVAAALSGIALATDRERALSIARQARQTLAEWPRTHFGYRQDEVRDIVTLLDASIARLAGDSPAGRFELSIVAMADPIELEPLAAMPTPREQLDQLVRLLPLTRRASDRVALLESGLALLADTRAGIDSRAVASIRRALESHLRQERSVDVRYARLTHQMIAAATRAAEDARIGEIQRVLERIPREDRRLGRRRPEVVQALTTSVTVQLDRARKLRLLRDQWAVRQAIFRQYQRSVGSQMLQLVKEQPALEAIRALAGPDPRRLAALRTRLSGGATRLERLQVPDYLRQAHELLVSAWRFAETAAGARYEAVSSGSITTAWEASSAAAGALMMLARSQEEIRALVEPPTLP